MPDSRHDYGLVNRLRAEAFGVPGQRTFRVLVANERESAALWLEKQSLAELGRLILTQLGRLRALRANPDLPSPDPNGAYTGEPSLDFRVGQLALGFDERQGIFLLLAYTAEDTEEDPPTLSCQATPQQCQALAEEIAHVVAAGRPTCPLCSQPIDPSGHACARANGHLKQPIPPVQRDEE